MNNKVKRRKRMKEIGTSNINTDYEDLKKI